jgi:REP element-mobilizing transposase RayT
MHQPPVPTTASNAVFDARSCGVDHYSNQDFEHRKQWVEDQLRLLADCFAVSIHAYAVMSNHLHVVVEMHPHAAALWSDQAIAQRWVRLFPARDIQATDFKEQAIMRNPERLVLLRERLSNLSWFMKCLAEPIARAANLEDGCTGRFWQGRFKVQVLCDEKALLAAMTYVDLNPVRACIATTLDDSHHTSVQQRIRDAVDEPEQLRQPLTAVFGIARCLPFKLSEYLDLVDYSGQQWHEGKRGRLIGNTPQLIHRLETRPARWMLRLKGVQSQTWRIIGDMDDLLNAAQRLGQRWVKGMGLARVLAKP